MSEISASLFYSVEQSIKETVDQSEIVRMARRHFDEESAKEMIKELKEQLIADLNCLLMEDEEYDEEYDEEGEEE